MQKFILRIFIIQEDHFTEKEIPLSVNINAPQELKESVSRGQFT